MQPITSRRSIHGVIFDFGSTLAINRAAWPTIIHDGAAAMTCFLARAGLPLPADGADRWIAAFRQAIQAAERDGLERSADATLAAFLADHGHPQVADDLVRRAADSFFAVEDAARAPATGAVALLQTLKAAGYRLAILSNAPCGRWVHHWADHFGFRPYLDVVLTSDEIRYRKPRPEAFQMALQRLGMDDPRQAVMVGDTPAHDLLGALDLGMAAVRVALAEDCSFDYRRAHSVTSPDAAIQPHAEITELAALIPILEGWQAHDD